MAEQCACLGSQSFKLNLVLFSRVSMYLQVHVASDYMVDSYEEGKSLSYHQRKDTESGTKWVTKEWGSQAIGFRVGEVYSSAGNRKQRQGEAACKPSSTQQCFRRLISV